MPGAPRKSLLPSLRGNASALLQRRLPLNRIEPQTPPPGAKRLSGCFSIRVAELRAAPVFVLRGEARACPRCAASTKGPTSPARRRRSRPRFPLRATLRRAGIASPASARPGPCAVRGPAIQPHCAPRSCWNRDHAMRRARTLFVCGLFGSFARDFAPLRGVGYRFAERPLLPEQGTRRGEVVLRAGFHDLIERLARSVEILGVDTTSWNHASVTNSKSLARQRTSVALPRQPADSHPAPASR